MKLILGVVDVAYSDANSGTKTTGDVAEILEAKYHVMQTFYDLYQDKIAEWAAESMAKAIESMAQGRLQNQPPLMDAEQKIEQAFRTFLDQDEMGKLLAGLNESERNYYLSVTGGDFTGAGKRGVNSRKKSGKNAGGKARPSFIDTGLYRASFRAWDEE